MWLGGDVAATALDNTNIKSIPSITDVAVLLVADDTGEGDKPEQMDAAPGAT